MRTVMNQPHVVANSKAMHLTSFAPADSSMQLSSRWAIEPIGSRTLNRFAGVVLKLFLNMFNIFRCSGWVERGHAQASEAPKVR